MISLKKPIAEFYSLTKCFYQYGHHFELPENTLITFPYVDANDVTLILECGEVFISQKYNDILLGIAQAPFIDGLSAGIIERPAQYIYTTQSICRGYYLSSRQVINLLDEHQLWREAFSWLTWWNRLAETRNNQLIGSSSYEQIRSTLLTMSEWDDNLRLRVGVMHYIQRRTGISRSVIAEVLSALRKGSYIEMYKGKLLKVNRLPSDY
jgi:hypothetical protein